MSSDDKSSSFSEDDTTVSQPNRQLRSTASSCQYVYPEGLCKQTLEKQPKCVGIIYDDVMLEPHSLWDETFPEKPDRLGAVLDRCRQYGLFDRSLQLQSRLATESELLMCHDREYITTVKYTAHMDKQQLMDVSAQYDAVYFHPESYKAACLSAGCSLELIDRLCKREIKHGMALLRPPGHHAMRDEACGYCIFNNAALAATYALQKHKMHRIVIIDWDVHHGQGTQRLFYDDNRVMYISMHRYDHGEFWPNLRESNYDYIGEGKGMGYNINIPLNTVGLTNGDYMAMLHQVILPILYQYNPDMVIISAGYDSVIGCPEGCTEVTPSFFTHWISQLRQLADSKLCVLLEGGYCIQSLAESAALTLKTLLGDPCPYLDPLTPPCESVVSSILHVIQCLTPYWSCFQYQHQTDGMQQPEIFSRHQPPANIEFATEENRPKKYELVGDYIIHPPEKVEHYKKVVTEIVNNTPLRTTTHRTCVAYDEQMKDHKCTSMGGHPERPDRISRIYQKLVDTGLWDSCRRVQSRKATREELCLVHSPEYIDQVISYQYLSLEELHEHEMSLLSVYLSKHSYECALLAAGCTLSVIDDVCTEESCNGIAVVRPPGHHAESDSSCGFCFFNNVAIAAKYAQQEHGLKRILIVDWDVHHGNGIQNAFIGDDSVLYISLHRVDIFPLSGEAHEVGKDKGEGYNINIPWERYGMGDAEYIAAFHQIILPIAYQFAPELVLVSAGFDAARGDPLGGCKISPECYGHMTQLLCGLANGRVVLVLEGGYNLISISESLAMCTSVLLNDACPRMKAIQPNVSAVTTINRVISIQKRYWSALQFQVELPIKKSVQAEATQTAIYEPTEEIASTAINDLMQDVSSISLSDLSSCTSHTHTSPDSADGRTASHSNETCTPAVYRNMGGGGIDNLHGEINGDFTLQMEKKMEVGVGGGGKDISLDISITGQDESVGNGVAERSTAREVDACMGACGPQPTDNEMRTLGCVYSVVPLPWCEHLTEVAGLPHGFNIRTTAQCEGCGNTGENWICLTCYKVFCSRYVNEHMLFHSLETNHLLCLSFSDLSVWCYRCNAYVHNEVLLPAKRNAHINKFGEDMPGLYDKNKQQLL